MNRFLLLVTIISSISFCVSGEITSIKSLGIQNGITNNYVKGISQDKRGFIWIATEEGLNCIEGNRIVNYYKDAEKNITGNELNWVIDDPVDSILWIATQRNGLNAYNYANNTFTTYLNEHDNPKSIVSNDITKVVAAKDGNIWLCTYWNGIDYYNKSTNEFDHYNTSNVKGLPDNNIWTVEDSGDGSIYVGHVRHGLSIISTRDRTAVNFIHNPQDVRSLPHNEVNSICKDSSGRIWIGTADGIALYNPLNGTFQRINDRKGSLSHAIQDIKQFDGNKLWIAMEYGGVAIVDLSSFFFQSPELIDVLLIKDGEDDYSLSSSNIRCLYQDSFKNIWIGTYGKGVDFIGYKSGLFGKYTYLSSNTADSKVIGYPVTSISFDDGKLLVARDQGIIEVFDNKVKTESFSLNTNMVQSIFCDSKGRIFFGLFSDGLRYKNKNGNTAQVFPDELRKTDVRDICELKMGDILVGTSNGIYRLDCLNLKIKAHYDSTYPLVRCLTESSTGEIWVGTFGGGLELYDADFNRITLFDMASNFPSNTVNDIYEDTQNRIWVATGDGVVCFAAGDKSKYKVYRRENGLQNTFVNSIVEDCMGNIWINNNKGISCIRDANEKILNYSYQDDIPTDGFFPRCMVKSAEGDIFFGSNSGLCHFNPSEILKERTAPIPQIIGIKIIQPINSKANSELEIINASSNSIKLDYNQNSFDILFSTHNYALKDDIEYAYNLKGLDSEWYQIGSANNVTFKNLPPGNYTFNLKSRIRNQDWSNEIVSLDFTVLPSFWQQWWIKVVYVLLALGIVASFIYIYRRRLKTEAIYNIEKHARIQEQNLNNERLRFYTNITHELRTPLTLILGPLEDLRKSISLSPKDSKKLGIIHQSALRLLDLINQLLEFRKVETQNRRLCVSRGNIVNTIREIWLKYKELNPRKDVELILQCKENEILTYYDSESINIIIDNLISNAFKYTESGEIVIGIERIVKEELDYIDIWVKDTGCGISPDAIEHIFDRYYQEGGDHQASGTGIGLSLVKSLISLHEGKIEVESRINEGSTFHVYILEHNSYPNALHAETSNANGTSLTETAQEPVETDKRPILLIVEDNAEICDYISESMSDKFDIVKAVNGRDGLEKAIKYIPDIIISDIMMPIMNGIKMCQELKKDMRTSHIPIIVLTAKNTIKDKEDGYHTGVDSYLTKPFSASLLYSRITNLLENRRRLAAYFGDKISDNVQDSEAIDSLSKLDRDFLDKINQMIEENLSSETLDIGYLANAMCMSGTTLYRKMKALTGLPTNEYIRKIKMRHVEKLLIDGHSVSETAFMTGFNSMSYFRKCFKKDFGCLPTEYIKTRRESSVS